MYSIFNPPTKIQATANSCIINHSCCCCGLVVDIGILEKYDFMCCIVYSKLLLLLLLTHVSSALLALQLIIIVLSTFNCINYLCKPLMLPFINLLISIMKLFSVAQLLYKPLGLLVNLLFNFQHYKDIATITYLASLNACCKTTI